MVVWQWVGLPTFKEAVPPSGLEQAGKGRCSQYFPPAVGLCSGHIDWEGRGEGVEGIFSITPLIFCLWSKGWQGSDVESIEGLHDGSNISRA